ncbi:hypothetical protein E2C01_033172 [Portunus trituberculatus]|uniref:Uncharacterized protein n=1 Tax=Portunus trituberculatus TaxID=210409 RepID=A0A5B7F2B0_PORTR|nr:hypothetical protein [Portunus trituberculatus]
MSRHLGSSSSREQSDLGTFLVPSSKGESKAGNTSRMSPFRAFSNPYLVTSQCWVYSVIFQAIYILPMLDIWTPSGDHS